MGLKQTIIDAFNIDSIVHNYDREIVEITDLKPRLKTKGHILLIRGDKAFVGNNDPPSHNNAKFWMLDNLLSSERIQTQLKSFPEKKLFDGVGFSAYDALRYFTDAMNRKAVVVMAKEFLPSLHERIEVVHGDKPFEQGYVAKQHEMLKARGHELIPLFQALYGPSAMAPIGNQVASILDGSLELPISAIQYNPRFHEVIGIKPDVALWVMASGSALYGVGRKLKQRFPNMRNVLVEPTVNQTIDPSLDLTDPIAVKQFARNSLKHYDNVSWDEDYSGMMPLHMHRANRYVLANWSFTGDTGIDKIINVPHEKADSLNMDIRGIEEDWYWTQTTFLTLAPAIELANEGKNVIVMAYGGFKYRFYRDLDFEQRLGMLDLSEKSFWYRNSLGFTKYHNLLAPIEFS